MGDARIGPSAASSCECALLVKRFNGLWSSWWHTAWLNRILLQGNKRRARDV